MTGLSRLCGGAWPTANPVATTKALPTIAKTARRMGPPGWIICNVTRLAAARAVRFGVGYRIRPWIRPGVGYGIRPRHSLFPQRHHRIDARGLAGGHTQAASATTVRIPATTANVIGSRTGTPNTRLASTWPSASAPTSARADPDQRPRHPLAHDEPQHRRCAERRAPCAGRSHASAGDRIRQDAVDADRRRRRARPPANTASSTALSLGCAALPKPTPPRCARSRPARRIELAHFLRARWRAPTPVSLTVARSRPCAARRGARAGSTSRATRWLSANS